MCAGGEEEADDEVSKSDGLSFLPGSSGNKGGRKC